MTLETIREAYDETFEQYDRHFSWKDCPGAGFGFPCLKDGTLLTDGMAQAGLDNLAMCLADGGEKLVDHGVRDISYSVRRPRVCRCKCGAELEMYGYGAMGDVECEKCERVYNSGGQELAGHIQPWSGQNEDGEYYWEEDAY